MYKSVIRILFVIALVIITVLFTSESIAYSSSESDDELRQHIKDKCELYGVSEALICGVIECESGWNPNAENFDGSCVGLMQISRVNKPALKSALGITDLYDPYQNTEAGIYMLSEYLEKYGDVDMALMCYNCGEGGAIKLRSQGVTGTSYSKKVQKLMQKYIVEEEEPVKTDKNFSLMKVADTGFTGTTYRICQE